MRLQLPAWIPRIPKWWPTMPLCGLARRRRIPRRKCSKWAGYLVIFAALVAFCAQTIEHLYIPSRKQKVYPQTIETANFTAVAITAGYPLSGYYGLTPVTITWVLVPVTILVRRARWLSASLIGITMIYSSTAVVHLMVLFVHNRRWDHNAPRNACEPFQLPDGRILPICQGIHDPDYILAGGLVAANLLAVLPFAKWSYTFQEPETKAILILWTLWLAIGHLFFIFIIPNDGINYQICPKGVGEPLPGMDYHAGDRNDAWNQRFLDIVFNRTEAALVDGRQCIYTAFGRDGYLGRPRDEIGIFEASLSNRYLNHHLRGLGISFWIVYTVLAAVGLFASKSHKHHPKPVLQLLWWRNRTRAWLEDPDIVRFREWLGRRFLALKTFQQETGQQAWCQLLNGTIDTSLKVVAWPVVKISGLIARTPVWRKVAEWSGWAWTWLVSRMKKEFKSKMGFSSECLVCIVKRYFVQFLSGVSFFGFVAFNYVEFVQLPKSEPFSAVGQWSSVAVISFVLLAAILVKGSLMIMERAEDRPEQDSQDSSQVMEVGIELPDIQHTATLQVDFGPAMQRANEVEILGRQR